MKHLAVSRMLALGMVALLSCSRDQSPDQAANGPITKVVLPTNAPRGVAPRLEVASTASPAAAPSAPDHHARPQDLAGDGAGRHPCGRLSG